MVQYWLIKCGNGADVDDVLRINCGCGEVAINTSAVAVRLRKRNEKILRTR